MDLAHFHKVRQEPKPRKVDQLGGHFLIEGSVVLLPFTRQLVDPADSSLNKVGNPGCPCLAHSYIVIGKEAGEHSWLSLKKLGSFRGCEHLKNPHSNLETPRKVKDLGELVLEGSSFH